MFGKRDFSDAVLKVFQMACEHQPHGAYYLQKSTVFFQRTYFQSQNVSVWIKAVSL